MRPRVRAIPIVLAIFLTGLAALAAAQKPVTASKGWVRRPAPNSTTTAAFVVVDNPTMYDVYIVSATSDAAAEVQLRETTATGGDTPRPIKEITVPAYGQVEMTPDGVHLVLVGLKRPLEIGETVTLTLVTDGNVSLQVPAVVREK
jgi:copper(I)-binding protein